METSLRVEQVEEEAARWLLRRDSSQWSSADEAQLSQWLQASLNHKVAFMRLRSVWRETNRLKVLSTSVQTGCVPQRGEIRNLPFFDRKLGAANDAAVSAVSQTRRSRTWRPSLRHGVAASILLIIGFGLAAYLGQGDAPSYRTPIGGLATVPMDDGSKITLNTDTEVSLESDDRERRVNLTQGEAFFDVAKDPARPFVVEANDQRIVAVGTKFAVRLKADVVQVAVTEGQVRLEQRSGAVGAFRIGAVVPKAPLLTPGTIASATADKVSIEQQPLAKLEQALSWRAGYVVLRRTELSDAVAEFNRYSRRQLVIDDPSIADIKVGGNFRSDNIDGFVRLLQEGFPIDVQESNNRIVLTRKPIAQ